MLVDKIFLPFLLTISIHIELQYILSLLILKSGLIL